MKRPGKHIPAKGGRTGFTLMEVMIAMGILAISLVAVFNVQASSMVAAGRVKNLTAATLLARSKMVDIEQQLLEEGFSDFAEELTGNFEEEGWPEFTWTAEVMKVKIPIPSDMPGGSEDGQTNPYASMMSGYASMITDLISNSLREAIVTVEWTEGKSTHSMEVATHFISLGRAQSLEAPMGGAGATPQTGGTNTSTNTAPIRSGTRGSGNLNTPTLTK